METEIATTEKLARIQSLIHTLRTCTQPVNGHTDPNSVQDCWNWLDELAAELLNPKKITLPTPKSLTIYSNGNVLAFDHKGAQMPDVHVSVISLYCFYLESRSIDPTMIQDIRTVVNGVWKKVKPFKTDDGGWNCQFLEITE